MHSLLVDIPHPGCTGMRVKGFNEFRSTPRMYYLVLDSKECFSFFFSFLGGAQRTKDSRETKKNANGRKDGDDELRNGQRFFFFLAPCQEGHFWKRSETKKRILRVAQKTQIRATLQELLGSLPDRMWKETMRSKCAKTEDSENPVSEYVCL